mmetsp:Transcript_5950/g.6081  ORF Transcript_5950/g.6081 Transcript_5950/m.6081 type:complete len:267 (-) Transcript_5950:893-1693(-)
MNFKDPLHWDNRYRDEIEVSTGFTLFDWYAPFDICYPMIESVIDLTKRHKILLLGIGKSGAIETLYEKGYRDIVAIDISPTVIRLMQQKYESYSGVEFMCLDVRRMSVFPDKSFSVVIDKACLDALFCEMDYKSSIQQALLEVHRVMKEEGIFTCISHASPMARVPYFRFINWAIKVLPLQEGCRDSGLSFFAITRTENNLLIEAKIKGAEFASQAAKPGNNILSLDQDMNKVSTMKVLKNAGSLTVTATPEQLKELIYESVRNDD